MTAGQTSPHAPLGLRLTARFLDFVLPGIGSLLAGSIGPSAAVLATLAVSIAGLSLAVCLGRLHPVNAALVYAVLHLSQGTMLALTPLPAGRWRARPMFAVAGMAAFLAIAGIGLFAGPGSVGTIERVDELASFPGLVPGEYVLVRRRLLADEAPERGDLLAAHTSEGIVFARVAGLPGDRVIATGPTLQLNDRTVAAEEIGEVTVPEDLGVPPEEVRGLRVHVEDLGGRKHVFFTRRGVSQAPLDEVVPDRSVYLVGDNRSTARARDSRETGPVPLTSIVGQPLFVLWSPRDEGGVRWDRIGAVWP